ncbi:MAG TPA: hypothetical protein VK779_02840 [Rhizomicrobium sp.]|nr:hypothetical protein [Rhizomicrobium sp.]
MLGRFFRHKSPLNSEDEAWQIETWRWLLKHSGGIDDLKLSPLVTPTRTYFPPSETTGHTRAKYIFECVKHLARMTDWPSELIAQPERPEDRIGDFAILKNDSNRMPLGTFRISGNTAEITYDPKSVSEPAVLIATLAHELAHYRLKSIGEETPGGAEMHEYATDIMTIYMGFGIFGANLAFNFGQHQDFQSIGWRWSRQGYLREVDWAFGLGVFAYLRGQPFSIFKELLKPGLYSDLAKTERYLGENPNLFRD